MIIVIIINGEAVCSILICYSITAKCVRWLLKEYAYINPSLVGIASSQAH